jgi:hypothetical protein
MISVGSGGLGKGKSKIDDDGFQTGHNNDGSNATSSDFASYHHIYGLENNPNSSSLNSLHASINNDHTAIDHLQTEPDGDLPIATGNEISEGRSILPHVGDP